MQVGGGELKLAQKYELWLQMQKERATQMVAENTKEQDDEVKEGRSTQGRKKSASKSGTLGGSTGQAQPK